MSHHRLTVDVVDQLKLRGAPITTAVVVRGLLIDEVVGGAGVRVAGGVLTGLEEVVLKVVLLGWL